MNLLRAWLLAFALTYAPAANALEAQALVLRIDIENDELTLSTGLVLRINEVSLDGIKPGMEVAVEYDEDDGENFLTKIQPVKAP